ncbi:MAG: group III truncated hemoglobin [Acidobacteriaceae bacterium]|nr:group III truncated hemoglobin [Acidobacteriaceae bacterium]
MYHTITEDAIVDLVDRFCGKIRNDHVLGPIFAQAIGADWKPHLAKMNAFWSSVLLASGTYKGNPMVAHLQLPRLTQHHFERWLYLWHETAAGLCSDNVASLFVRKAQMIGERLLHAISNYHESSEATGAAREAI